MTAPGRWGNLGAPYYVLEHEDRRLASPFKFASEREARRHAQQLRKANRGLTLYLVRNAVVLRRRQLGWC